MKIIVIYKDLPEWDSGVINKENYEYPTKSRGNRRIFRHSAPMRLGANRQRGMDSVRKNTNEVHKVN